MKSHPSLLILHLLRYFSSINSNIFLLDSKCTPFNQRLTPLPYLLPDFLKLFISSIPFSHYFISHYYISDLVILYIFLSSHEGTGVFPLLPGILFIIPLCLPSQCHWGPSRPGTTVFRTYSFWLRTCCPCGWKSLTNMPICLTFSMNVSNWFSSWSKDDDMAWAAEERRAAERCIGRKRDWRLTVTVMVFIFRL